MNGFYYLVSTLRDYLKANGFINTVTTGDIYEVDLSKQTLYPLTHIIVNNAIPKESTLVFNLSILFMDIIDLSKSETIDVFENNDNLLDILNTQLALATRMVEDLRRGFLFDEYVQIEGEPLCEPFTDRFENLLAGWKGTISITVPSHNNACKSPI